MAFLGTKSLTFTLGGTDYTASAAKCVVVSGKADADKETFADAAAGGLREYRLNVLAKQDLNTASLWDKVWSSAGTSVAVLVRPYGNATASVTQPHFSGNVIITEPDGELIGGEADSNTLASQWFEVSWVFTAKPTKVTV